MSTEIRLAVVGTGNRGAAYTHIAGATGLARVMAVAEPRESRRTAMVPRQAIDPGLVVDGWRKPAAGRRRGRHWLARIVGRKAVRVSSFGSLYHFRPENRPDGAADRCLDCGVEAVCPYSAKKLYMPPSPPRRPTPGRSR